MKHEAENCVNNKPKTRDVSYTPNQYQDVEHEQISDNWCRLLSLTPSVEICRNCEWFEARPWLEVKQAILERIGRK